MWPDNETDRDLLNFAGVADTVAEIVAQANGRPISIGVSGAWGSGKSSMIKLVQAALVARPAAEGTRQFVFVEFNAWLYQGYDDARAALMDVIADTLEAEAEKRKSGIEKVKDLAKRIRWLRGVKLLGGSALALALGLPPTGILGELLGIGKKAVTEGVDEKLIQSGQEKVEEGATALSGVWGAKVHTSPPKEIQALRSSFEATLDEMGVTLVVLIDDLDRCLPSTTISTLEAIRLFLFLRNTAFVIAADTDMIKYAVRRHFEGVSDDLVTSYFDKLIQVPIRVPPLGTQEVRAYLIMLFVDNANLGTEGTDKIRRSVAEQLKHTWQGKRVDRAFVQALVSDLPADLITKLDSADRLAPMMATAKGIAGNPRLIKRFLNALAIRLSIAKIHGVGVDEAVLAKLLLFERLGATAAFDELLRKVGASSDGKPTFLAEWEEKAHQGEDQSLPSPWDGGFVRDWLALPPRLAAVDLRGALYVSREHAPIITPEERLSSDAADVLAGLLQHPEMALTLKTRLGKLARTETTVIMDRLLDKARQEQEWGAPPILEACLVVSDVDPSQGSRLAAFLRDRPSTQIRPNIVPKVAGRPWSRDVFGAWEQTETSRQVKAAIKAQPSDGNLAV